MSFLKNFFLESPLPIGEDLFLNDAEKFISEFDRRWEGRLLREEQLLASLRLPVPQRKALTYSIENKMVRLNRPDFLLPPHLTYDAFRPVEPMPVTPGALKREWMCYVILGKDNKEITKLRGILEQDGIIGLLQLDVGTWYNRDPYQMYKYILQHWNDGWWPTDYSPAAIEEHIKKTANKPSAMQIAYSTNHIGEPAPLFKVTGYDFRDMTRFQERIEFYNRITPIRTQTSPFLYLPIAPTPEGKRQGYAIADELLFSLQVPKPDYPRESVVLKITPPVSSKLALFKDFLNGLHSAKHPLSFELIDTGETAHFQMVCGNADCDLIDRQLELYFPEAVITPIEDCFRDKYLLSISLQLTDILDDSPTLSTFTIDPYSHFASVLTRMPPEEMAALRVGFWPFPRTILESVPRESLPGIIWERFDRKMPVWMVTMDVLASTKEWLAKLKQSFLTSYTSASPKWSFIEDEQFFDDRGVLPNMLLSSQELASFVHFPTSELTFDRLETSSTKQKLPPDAFTMGETTIGESQARGVKKAVRLPNATRDRHLYVVGKSGTGKSTLIFNAALQDILRGAGVAVIDPHGDLVASGEHGLLNYIPEHRIKDTIYLNAADKDHPISMNLMAVSNDEELDLMATNLQTTFRRLSDSWGERMDNLLRFALHTLVQTPRSTFFDLKRLLQNAEYRKQVVGRLTDDRLVDFWQNDFPAYRDSVQPIISRMGKFMLGPLYGMLAQPESHLNFYEVIQQRKILLINLGGIGEDDAQLLGSLLVSQLQLAVMQRGKLPPNQRHPYYLYVDEFQNFTSRAFGKILSEARKYQLCLTLAHQFISQLGEAERDAIFGNIGTMIMFGVGDKDAQTLRHQLGKFEPLDLANLPKYHALCRPEQASDTFLFITSVPPARRQSFAERILEHSRATYGTEPPKPNLRRVAPLTEEAPQAEPAYQPTIVVPPAAPDVCTVNESAEPAQPHHDSEPKTPFAERPPRVLMPPEPLGRGGQQHKYLQQLIKRLAEDKGYRVIIEHPVLAGVGSIDVSLERNGRRIACEISVSSTSEYEFKNIQKCLAAGFDQVVMLSSEKRALTKIQKLAAAEFDGETNQKLHFFLPEEFVQFLEQDNSEHISTEKTVRGYKVKVKYKAGGNSEQVSQRQAIAQVILQALKRLKDEN